MFVSGPPPEPRPPSPPSRRKGRVLGRGLSLPALESEIATLAAHINAAECRWLLLVAEFDRRDGHERAGFVSCASWLAWRCSLDPRSAREKVRVARRLVDLPVIRASFARGTLSYSKVRALCRVAEPEMEAELVEMAQHATAAQLERLVGGYRRAIADDEHTAAHERRHLSLLWDDTGSLIVRGSLPAEEGALLLKAIDLVRRSLEAPADSADALVAMASRAATEGPEEGRHKPRGLGAADRHQVVIHVDADKLGAPDDGAAQIEDGPAVPLGTARRLACDASLVTLVERDGVPLSVGRKTRSVPPSIARALRSRDRTCTFPGCERAEGVEAHHVEHWARGGETSLENLIQLCPFHHRLVHEGGHAVEMERGSPVFRDPRGRKLAALPPPQAGSLAALRRTARAGGGELDPDSLFPRSAGGPMDRDLAVFALAARRERALAEAAPP